MNIASMAPATQDILTHRRCEADAISYCSTKPYPLPEGLSRNIRYARILQCAYSAGNSELTGIHQYTYHAIAIERESPVLSRALKEIAVVELHHLHLLGQCIMLLGLLPTFGYYQGTRRARWNSGFVQYARGPKGIIDLSIKAELQTIEFYQNAIERISDEQINALLSRIIEDEQVHIGVLEELRE